MAQFKWPSLLSRRCAIRCAIRCVSPFFNPHFCEFLSRKGTHFWTIDSEEKEAVQCGYIHSIARINKDMIHCAKSHAVETGSMEMTESKD